MRPHRHPASRILLPLLLLLVSAPGRAQSAPPDLGRLYERVRHFWDALQQGKRSRALRFVEPETRDTFLAQKPLPFLAFRVAALEFSQEADRIQVTVRARVGPPYSPQPLDWPVRQSWVYREGEWWLHARKGEGRNLFRARPSERPGAPGSEKRKRYFQEQLAKLTVEPGRLDFGRVRRGELVSRKVILHNGGAEAVLLNRPKFPPWVGYSLRTQRIAPGRDLVLPLMVMTSGLAGDVNMVLRLDLQCGTARASREVSLRGAVRVLFEVIPRQLELFRGQASSARVRIRSHIAHEVTILRALPPADFIHPDPAFRSVKLNAGGQVELKVEWDVPEPGWKATGIRLLLDRPVEGRSELVIPVVYREK